MGKEVWFFQLARIRLPMLWKENSVRMEFHILAYFSDHKPDLVPSLSILFYRHPLNQCQGKCGFLLGRFGD